MPIIEIAADDPEILAGRPFRGANQRPDLPGWRAAMLARYDATDYGNITLLAADEVSLSLLPRPQPRRTGRLPADLRHAQPPGALCANPGGGLSARPPGCDLRAPPAGLIRFALR